MSRLGLGLAFLALWLGAAVLLGDEEPVRAAAPVPGFEDAGGDGRAPGAPLLAALALPGDRTAGGGESVVEFPAAVEARRTPVAGRQEQALSEDLLDGLFADLRDDDVKGNARYALHRLERLMEGGPLARAAIRARAERGLDSYDRQESDLCTELLLPIALLAWHDEDRAAPHRRGLALAAKELDGNEPRSYRIANSPVHRRSLELAIAYPDAMEPYLVQLLRSRAASSRRSAAIALACARREPHAARIVDELLPGLWDNDTPNDALTSAFALQQLGPSALPHLPSEAAARDQQQRLMLRAIRADIAAPGSSRGLGLPYKLSRFASWGPSGDWQPDFTVRRD